MQFEDTKKYRQVYTSSVEFQIKLIILTLQVGTVICELLYFLFAEFFPK